MKLIQLTALAVLMAFGVASAQDVEKKMELKVVVAGDGASDGHEVHWVSDDAGLEDLAVGESKTITGESGSEVVVTKTENGMQFEVEGETIMVPDMGAHGTHMAFVDAEGGHGDIDVRVMKGMATGYLDYPNPAMRQIGDLDILIRGSDMTAAIAVVPRLGLVDDLCASARFRAVDPDRRERHSL